MPFKKPVSRRHAGAAASTVVSQHEGYGFDSDSGLSARSLYVLLVRARVLSRCSSSGFFTLSKDYTIGVIVELVPVLVNYKSFMALCLSPLKIVFIEFKYVLC